jgi:hypothetical protein
MSVAATQRTGQYAERPAAGNGRAPEMETNRHLPVLKLGKRGCPQFEHLSGRNARGVSMTDQSSAKRGRLRRVARLKAAMASGNHTFEEWSFLQAYCGGKCVGCGARFILAREAGEYLLPDATREPWEWERFTKDHVKPLFCGGSNSIDNIQPMCRGCNSAKGTSERDWRPRGWREALDRALAEGWERPPQMCIGCPPGCRECVE